MTTNNLSGTRILTKTSEHYAADRQLVVRQRSEDKETTLAIRRVVRDVGPSNPNGVEELQIEIEICKIGAKRNTTSHVSFCASPQVANAIAAACGNVLPQHDGRLRLGET